MIVEVGAELNGEPCLILGINVPLKTYKNVEGLPFEHPWSPLSTDYEFPLSVYNKREKGLLGKLTGIVPYDFRTSLLRGRLK